jgi:hypothetical protein
MTKREQLKLELDSVDDATIEILRRILMALKQPVSVSNNENNWLVNNPLKNSVVRETDIIAPIGETWDIDR